MTLLQIYNVIKELYLASSAEVQEYFSLKTLYSSLFEKYLIKREQLILNPLFETPCAEDIISDAKKALSGYPIQYIVGKVGFWNEEYFVSDGVLIPRSDTETIVEQAIKHLNKDEVVYDLCCGCGCIGISILKSRPDIKVCVSADISPIALEYTRKNALYNGVSERLITIEYDIMSFKNNFPIDSHYPDLIVSNPPYITQDEMKILPQNVKFEPEIALVGGKDGCDFYRKILKDFSPHLHSDGYIIFEISPSQETILKELFSQCGYVSEFYRDFSANIRVALGRKF